MKHTKVLAILAIAVVAVLAVPAVAYANFAIHGNYVHDTAACAGCHRAHTAVSTVTWQDATDPNTQHSALLVTSASESWQFCYACHDGTSQGADTNVEQGIYEGTLYGTQYAVLNGGGFTSLDASAVTSTHLMDGSSWGAYGGGYFGQGITGADGQIPGANTGESVQIKMDCTSCHDPHGSANYRILRASVNGNAVGGYQPTAVPDDPDPDGFVSSVETGWPVNGFRLHTAYPNYEPNYTAPMYARGYDMTSTVVNQTKGMSGWCIGCHSTYMSEKTVLTKTDAVGNTTTYTASASVYNAGDGSGLKLRHRHPINVPLSGYNGPDKVNMIVAGNKLPLDHALSEIGSPANQDSDWIECLTCHRAHGTAANMTGFATAAGAASVVDTDGVARNNFISGTPSALLRFDNREVCEACHNK